MYLVGVLFFRGVPPQKENMGFLVSISNHKERGTLQGRLVVSSQLIRLQKKSSPHWNVYVREILDGWPFGVLLHV